MTRSLGGKRPVLLQVLIAGMSRLAMAQPVEFEEVPVGDRTLRVPTLPEITRIKAWLCLMRNATRDYIDFAALSHRLGDERTAEIISGMDEYYTDQQGPGGRRVATQVARQLAEPRPDDLSDIDLLSYRELERRWQDWGAVADICKRTAVRMLDRLAEESP